MRIAIVGSRSITDKDMVFNQINKFLDREGIDPTANVTFISGGATGVDSLVRDYAKHWGADFILFKPYHMIDNKVKFDTKYFFVRNRQMIDNADKVLVIWDGQSRGAGHAKEYAEKRNKDVSVVVIND